MPYNVLVLHNLGDFDRSLRSMVDYLLCFERYAAGNSYFYHRWTEPPTDALRRIDFHVVILDASMLGVCRYRPREKYYAIKERWAFIAGWEAVKLAFPQDDYHQSNVLDELFDDWNVDVIYSVLPEHMHMLYPRSGKKAWLRGALTGYIEDRSVDLFKPLARPFWERQWDVGQRCTMYSPVGGRYGQLKGRMAEAFRVTARDAGLSVDISTDPADTIRGDGWLEFLGDCRFVLGGEGGVSLWDPDGQYHDRVRDYLERHPGAGFEEVEQACFPAADMKHVFSAISPRLFEATMMGCSQILIEAPYLGLLKPHEHYIPVKRDLSDVAEAVAETRDRHSAERRARATYDVLMNEPKLRYSGLVREVFADVDALAQKRAFKPADAARTRLLWERHRAEAQQVRAVSEERRAANLAATIAERFPLLRRAVPPRLRQVIKRLLS